MVIHLTNQPTIPRNNAAQVRFSPHFGAGPSTAGSSAVKDIAHIDIANGVLSGIRKLGITKDIRVGGLSLEDISGRLQTLIGVYILQGFFAYKDQKHPWETNGRNAVVWTMTAALTSWSKSDSYGVNTLLFNHFMKEKGTPNKIPGMKALLDLSRMDVDYLKILEAAGIDVPSKDKEAAMKGKKALWASSWLDSNKVMRIQNHLESLHAKKLALKAGETLSEADQKMMEAIPHFFKRVNLANFGSTALITAATVYLIGSVAMQIVNKLFTPLDEDTGMLSIKTKSQKQGCLTKPAAPSAAPASFPGAPLPYLQTGFRPVLPAMPPTVYPYHPGGLN
jgi:hypothetical protein